MPVPHTLIRAASAALMALAGSAQAAVIEGADIGGFRTFIDTGTGTVWADLDNHLTLTGTGYAYRFADYADYLDALAAAGFTWAFAGQVLGLTSSLPLSTSAGYDAFGQVMGSLSFGETTTLSGYSNASDGLVLRQYGAVDYGTGTASWAMGGLTTLPVALNDSGLWAYLTGPGPGGGGGGSVPLPGTLGLAGLGLVALASRRRATA